MGSPKQYKNFSYIMLASLFLGICIGGLRLTFVYKTSMAFSNIFMKCLQLLSLPMIFLAVTSTLSGLKNLTTARILGRKVLFYTILTTIIASSLGLALYLISFSNSLSISGNALDPTRPTLNGGQSTYLDFIFKIFPNNIVTPFSENNVIGVVLIAFAIGLATLFLPAKEKETLNGLFSALFAANLKVVQFIVQLMPLAIFAFIVILIHDILNHNFFLKILLKYLICVITANLVQGFVILPLFLKTKRFSPIKLIKKLFPVLSIAFFSKSSNATLPITLEVMETEVGISPVISRFSLPLCSVINMNGCAAFIIITTLFIGIHNGLTFSFYKMLLLIGLSTLAAIGNAGIPMGCFFLTGTLLTSLGCSLEMMGYILPFYAFIDMIETALNVWSDCVITTIVNKDMSPNLKIQ